MPGLKLEKPSSEGYSVQYLYVNGNKGNGNKGWKIYSLAI